MIVDYNYKPYVYSAPPGITFYAPPSKNNKGAIVLVGSDNLNNIYNPQITYQTPTGEGLQVNLDLAALIESGSIYDMFMQFKRERGPGFTTTRTSDINMVPYDTSVISSASLSPAPYFVPITYLSMGFTFSGSPSSWTRALTIITLY